MTDKDFDLQISRIVSGDRQGLKSVYDEYGKMIYSVAFGILRSKENAEDVTSEFFIRLWTTAAAQYSAGNGHRCWLSSIARNMALDYLRKNSHEQLVSEDEDGTERDIPDSSPPPDEAVTQKLALAHALESLDPTERSIISLKFEADLTFKEIARVMKKPMGTVTWKYRSAIEKLRRCSDCE